MKICKSAKQETLCKLAIIACTSPVKLYAYCTKNNNLPLCVEATYLFCNRLHLGGVIHTSERSVLYQE